MDRSQDPSPFSWIFGGALALLGVGALVRALRRRPEPDLAWAEQPAPVDDDIAGHPS